ncbi:MAG: IS5 family transposase, partial [Nitrososphaerota archaeon]|nr:IS5 family transposase [Nitrososphaerota archaeon]
MSWHDYNESLVERGRVLFDLGFASRWNDELEGMNGDKTGRPYEFPESYIEFLSFFRVGFNAPYRVIEGMTGSLSEYLAFVKEMHFTQVRRRILAMVKRKKPEYVEKMAEGKDDDAITVVVDSTGLSTTNKGSYIEAIWRKEKRKFIKLHVVADGKTGKIVGFRVTSEKTGDTKKFVPMVREVARKRRVARAYADSAYDSRRNFPMHERGIDPAIKLRKNASEKAKWSPLRKDEAILVRRVGYEKWKELKGYGKRWMAEIVFSAFKRVLGDTLMARRFLSQKAEATLKVVLYNRF